MKIIFEQYLTDSSLYKIEEKLSENPDFVLNDSNISEFFDCEYVLEILEKNNIKPQIDIKESWAESKKIPNYLVKLIISISENDYENIKQYFEDEINDSEQNSENDEIIENSKREKIILYTGCTLFAIIGLGIISILVYSIVQ